MAPLIKVMKKTFLSSAVAVVVVFFTSCGSSKNAISASKAELENPYGVQLSQTKSEQMAAEAPGRRAFGKGVSFNESTAHQIAEMDARAKLSRALDAAIVSASKAINFDITQYAGSDNEGMKKTDGGEQQNSLTKSISSNIVSGATVINSDKFYGKDRKYTVFVCLEYNSSVAEIAKNATEQIKQRVSDDDRKKIQQENEKYQMEVENNLKQNK